jgi:hypothetical protein
MEDFFMIGYGNYGGIGGIGGYMGPYSGKYISINL